MKFKTAVGMVIRKIIYRLLKRNFRKDEIAGYSGIFLSLEGNNYIKYVKKLCADTDMKEGIDFLNRVDFRKYVDFSSGNRFMGGQQREWETNEFFPDAWDKRIRLMLKHLDAQSQSLLDIGCGREHARDILREINPQCVYFGMDYKKRTENTLVFDLNLRQFPQDEYDVFFMSGSLEYIQPCNLEWFFSCLSNCKNQVLISYCSMERTPDLRIRKGSGWKSNLTLFEIICYLNKAGFELRSSEQFNDTQIICDFRRFS